MNHRCDDVQMELSVAHDEGRPPTAAALAHVESCPDCAALRADLVRLDSLLARGATDQAPTFRPLPATRSRPGWRWLAAAAVTGVLIGVVMAGSGGLATIQAHELDARLHDASPAVAGLQAEMVVVERGWHPDVPERVYGGTLSYAAPEQLSIELVDTTDYPGPEWVANDVVIEVSDGDVRYVASSPCPVEAMPGCLRHPAVSSRTDLKPFDEAVASPLQIVGPTSFHLWGGLEVVGTPTLGDHATIQVETTVAGAELVDAITDRGAWRALHPTDRVVMWLDDQTLAPLRLEVFATPSPDRELWQIRHGYDDAADQPILVIALENLTVEQATVEAETVPAAPSAGFADGPADVPQPVLPDGFTPHRSGTWILPSGGQVETGSWSDGRSWLRLESTSAWSETRLFGIEGPFARRVELGDGSVGYLSPEGDAIALHTAEGDLALSGSVPEELLVEVASSLEMTGLEVPDDWAEASVQPPGRLRGGTLVPRVEGWSILGFTSGDRTEILLTGSGRQNALVTSQPGRTLAPPAGADVVEVEVRGRQGRFDASAGILEWVEDGQIVRLISDTVGRETLIELAETMRPQ